MAFELAPDPGEKGAPETGREAVGGVELDRRRLIVGDGVQVLAHGAMVCPSCALPIALAERMGAGAATVCPYCDHAARARDFVRPDVFDAVGSEVYLVARVA